MPKGVYPRTANQLKAAVANLAKGREPEARAKANATLKMVAQDMGWRLKVSDATRKRMRDPEVRGRHLAGLKEARRKHGTNFLGGNGQQPTQAQLQAADILTPLGFVRELAVRTRGHGTEYLCPNAYKVDFGHPARLLAVELDGSSHNSRSKQLEDFRKTTILEALGWKVFRIKHGKEVCPHHLDAILKEF